MEMINRIKDYFVSMEMYEGRWVVVVRYNPQWTAYQSDDGRIKVSRDEKKKDTWWYYATDKNVEIDEIINLICETIETNIEVVKKVELLKIKAKELKEIFANEKYSFSDLEKLMFVFAEETTTGGGEKKKNEKTMSKKDMFKSINNEINAHDILNETQPEVMNVKSEIKPAPKNRSRKKTFYTEKEEIIEPVVKGSIIEPVDKESNDKNISVGENKTEIIQANDMTKEEIDELRG